MEVLFDKTTKNLVPLLKRPVENKHIPNIVNMVSTTSILPPGYRLPLRELNVAMGPCSQYAPVQFAANILKFTTRTADSTLLVFASGKLVLVSAISEYHTIYINQLFRTVIEQIKCAMVVNQNVVKFGDLTGRTIFENNKTHNVVGQGDLGMKIDLNALRDANPASVKWLPDSFPAAKCSMWLTDDNKCHCQGASGALLDESDKNVLENLPNLRDILLKKKCHCTIKCLCFDTGKIVLIGGERVRDVNIVFHRLQQLIPQFRNTNQYTIPQEERFEHRIGTMLVRRNEPAAGGEFSTTNTTNTNKKQTSSSSSKLEKTTLSPVEEIGMVLYLMDKFKPKYFHKARKTIGNDTVRGGVLNPPIVQFAIDGRVKELKMLILLDPDVLDTEDAQEAIRLVEKAKGKDYVEVLKILRK